MLVKLLKATRMVAMVPIKLLALKITPKQVTRLLQGSDTPDQNGASAPVDLQSEEECKDEYWLLNLLNMCPQQQSSPELQPFISYDPL
ncbi:hypothetical protein BASA50_006790 [Batrachochytrium salamandrivorans]|uniref:Uncharacterized protein n=1 Tax=Batrachochytrium salamandrivorans TaxID=1357716 RepID=A0ABQ8F8T6_9FUNG|nr:hypothetical protein BASA50_006790 [Batrachochytrium salamandrivorans]